MMQMAKPERSAVTNQDASYGLTDFRAVLVARLVLGFLFFFAFFMGFWVAGGGLHDPDTCWLLALGKHIFEHGSIPSTDPFSYTFSALEKDGTVNLGAVLGQAVAPTGRTFVPYQWLSEVLFYLAYKVAAGYSLLLFANTVLLTAFLAGPLMLFRSLRSPMLPAIGIVILGVVAASFHFLVRPEIFSYLFFLVWIGLFLRVRLKLENNRSFRMKDIRILLPQAGLMAIWSNMHTGFTSVFIALSLYCVVCTVEVLARPKVRKSALILPWLSFFTMLLASFINPFGVRLWSYIPELFFSPINRFISELSKANLTEWIFYPYYLLGIVVLLVVAKVVQIWRKKGSFPIGFAYSIVMPISVFIAGICCMRLIPFVVVILCAEVAWLLKGHTRPIRHDVVSIPGPGSTGSAKEMDGNATTGGVIAAADGSGVTISVNSSGRPHDASAIGSEALQSTSSFDANHFNQNVEPQTISGRLSHMLEKGGWVAALLFLSLFGVVTISMRAVQPNIPQGSGAFPAPYSAIKVLANELPKGRVFNSPQFGDMMIWHLISQEKPILGRDPFNCPAVSTKPRVFIDTRFDMYGAPLVSDHHTMENALPGWRDLFERYNFDWVFMPPKANIVKELLKDPAWKAIYTDKEAVIFVRADRAP